MRTQALIGAMLLTLTTCNDEDPCVEKIQQETAVLLSAANSATDDQLQLLLGIPGEPDGGINYFMPYMANALICERGDAGYCSPDSGANAALVSLSLCLERR